MGQCWREVSDNKMKSSSIFLLASISLVMGEADPWSTGYTAIGYGGYGYGGYGGGYGTVGIARGMVAMPGQVDMWLQILGRSTLQRGLLSQNPNMQLATLAWVGTGLGSEATLPWDTLCLPTLPWATPQATQGHMG